MISDLDMAALQKNAAGHLQSLAIHPACFLGTQECDNATDIIGNTDPSQCRLGSDHFLYLGIGIKSRLCEIRLNGTRCDQVGPDTSGSQFLKISAPVTLSAGHLAVGIVTR